MAEQEKVEPRRGREGGRWINERPTSEEFGKWFHENMKVDEKLDAANYIGGVVLIPAVDTKAKMVTGFRNGKPIIEEGEELSYIPYAKVETRINYFWDMLDEHSEWVAFVDPVASPRLTAETTATQHVDEDGKVTRTTRPVPPSALVSLVHQLPPGYSVMSVPVGEGFSHFLCYTTLVEVYGRAAIDEALESTKLMQAAVKPNERMAVARSMCAPLRRGQGTKQVPMHKGGYGSRQPYADDSSLMKAETGSLGRALGFAGIFVIPGSGVATAEDVQEALSQGQTPAQASVAAPTEGNPGPAAPDAAPVRSGAEKAVDEETQLKAKAMSLRSQLKKHEAKEAEFVEWAHERHLTSLADAKGAALRGVVKTLERLLDEAKKTPPTLPATTLTVEPEGGEEDGGSAAAPNGKPSAQPE